MFACPAFVENSSDPFPNELVNFKLKSSHDLIEALSIISSINASVMTTAPRMIHDICSSLSNIAASFEVNSVDIPADTLDISEYSSSIFPSMDGFADLNVNIFLDELRGICVSLKQSPEPHHLLDTEILNRNETAYLRTQIEEYENTIINLTMELNNSSSHRPVLSVEATMPVHIATHRHSSQSVDIMTEDFSTDKFSSPSLNPTIEVSSSICFRQLIF